MIMHQKISEREFAKRDHSPQGQMIHKSQVRLWRVISLDDLRFEGHSGKGYLNGAIEREETKWFKNELATKS